MCTNTEIPQTVNEYAPYEMAIAQQQSVNHPEEFYQYEQSNQENFTV